MTEYDAASVIEERERMAPPRWLRIACPTCHQERGYRCGRLVGLGIVRVPHVARMRAAAAAGILR
jgi:hypothetical protein